MQHHLPDPQEGLGDGGCQLPADRAGQHHGWTSVVQRAMYEYAESHMILSEVQSGFRQRASRCRPLQLLLMAMEDADLQPHATDS